MMTTGAIRSFFFALAMVWSGSVTVAQSSAAKPAAKAASPATAAPATKAAAYADPFEETSTPPKPAARTAVLVPSKASRSTDTEPMHLGL
jgi:hypothetical protein